MFNRIVFRDILSIVFLVFLTGWFVLIAYLVRMAGVSVIEALGLGTVTGIFLKAFSDMWQFYYRKAPSDKGGQEGK